MQASNEGDAMSPQVSGAAEKAPKKKRSLPSAFTILFGCLLFVAALTWIVSAFTDQVTGATLPQILDAPFAGFESALQVCLFIMVLGGFLAVVNKTGALDAGIAALVDKLGDHRILLIPVLMILFGICGSTYGMMEETVPFYILLASVAFSAGFDTMTGALIVLLGAGLGTLGSTVNPFSVGVATASLADLGIAVHQGITMGFGFIAFLIAEALGIVFVMRYAKRVEADPSKSAMTAQECEQAAAAFGKEKTLAEKEEGKVPAFTRQQKIVLILFALSFVIMIVSFIPWDSFGIDLFAIGATEDNPAGAWSAFLTGLPLGQWYFNECGMWFFVMSIVIGLIAHMKESELVNTFLAGAADIVSVALVVAVARGISVLMSITGFDMWVLEAAASGLAGVPAVVFAPLCFGFFLLLSFVIPSSSGMAALTMPIMGPLAVSLNFSPEIMIMIYVIAHGVILLFTPTNGVLLAGLDLAKTSYTSFLKASGKFLILLTIVMAVLVTVGMMVV